jgi:hypothetical protein
MTPLLWREVDRAGACSWQDACLLYHQQVHEQWLTLVANSACSMTAQWSSGL